MRGLTPLSRLQLPGVLALSDSEKAEALAGSLEAQYQPMNDPSEPAIFEMVNKAMRAHEYAPTSEPTSEILQVIKGLNASGPNGIPNRVLRHLPSAR
jgi:hypothetical protein